MMSISNANGYADSIQIMRHETTAYFNGVIRALRIAGLAIIVLLGAVLAQAQSGGGQAVIVPPASSGSGTVIQGEPAVGNIPMGTGSAFAAQAKPVFDVRDYANLAATISAATTGGGRNRSGGGWPVQHCRLDNSAECDAAGNGPRGDGTLLQWSY